MTLLPISSLCSDLAFVHAAIQPNIARTPGFDGQFALQTPEDSATGISLAGLPGLMLWLNVEVHRGQQYNLLTSCVIKLIICL